MAIIFIGSLKKLEHFREECVHSLLYVFWNDHKLIEIDGKQKSISIALFSWSNVHEIENTFTASLNNLEFWICDISILHQYIVQFDVCVCVFGSLVCSVCLAFVDWCVKSSVFMQSIFMRHVNWFCAVFVLIEFFGWTWLERFNESWILLWLANFLVFFFFAITFEDVFLPFFLSDDRHFSQQEEF